MLRHHKKTCLATALSLAVGTASAQSAPAAVPTTPQVVAVVEPQRVEVTGNYMNAVGTSDAASQGVVTSALIESRPTLRPAEVLEFVPGVIVTQHSGDGKANQYFLRGFNLDHGTDFATFVDGMPVNMPTHAHGHGYSDLNWLMPELVDRIAYKKGPYFADEGDFSSAGAAHIALFDTLPRGIASATIGQEGYNRAFLAKSTGMGAGNLLAAIEVAHNDGPWDNPEKFHRFNSVLRYSFGEGDTHQSITGMAYTANWDSTDQIPLRAVQDGLIGRFGALDPSDGGKTSRYSLSYDLEKRFKDGNLKFNAYAIESRLDLFSDFTYFLDNPQDLDPSAIGGDQFEQAEHRKVFGLAASRSWNATVSGLEMTNTLGVQARQDRLDPVGLYSTVARVRAKTVQQSKVRETSAAVYAENATQWTPWLRSVAGVRFDNFNFDVTSSIAANSGKRDASITSPKLSLILGPWDKTEFFINAGTGFHSNDARGTTETVTPKEGLPANPVNPLVRSKGAELGLRTQVMPDLQSSIALWVLHLDSELVFSGDAGDTEASRASLRKGVEWNNHYIASRNILLDADLSFSRAKYTQYDAAGSSIPGSIETVASFGATLKDWGPWFGQFQFRYFGPRPLIEDNGEKSKATTLAYLRAGYKFTETTKLTVDVFNLFNRKASDIDYYYASRLKGEPAEGVNDINFHPVEPRSFRVTLSTLF